MAIDKYCYQHTNPHGYRDSAQHRNHPMGEDRAQGRESKSGHGIPKAEDGQKYSESFMSPTDMMHGYPGGIRPQSNVGNLSGGETAMKARAVPHNVMVNTTVGAVDGDRPNTRGRRD
jgi:hypothetical protein